MSDAVGFAASIWKRGMRVAHVPTSTRAMVDAAWGGKTAFNFEGKKNGRVRIGHAHKHEDEDPNEEESTKSG